MYARPTTPASVITKISRLRTKSPDTIIVSGIPQCILIVLEFIRACTN